ncbi:MAG: 6-carboxyhexanoate--CoA ligase [Leptospirillum sp.]|jgi:6-carboxyhexanoate--CoA ligase|nr:hypothetical protein [Nitrospiraceae bacterium]
MSPTPPISGMDQGEPAEALYNVRMRTSVNGKHYSGGEEILPEKDIEEGVARLFKRGFESPPRNHRAEISISLKVDGIAAEQIRKWELLPVRQLESDNEETTKSFIRSFLALSVKEISSEPEKSVQNILDYMDSFQKPWASPMWGASLLAPSGEIVPTSDHGVRTTHIGIRTEARLDLLTFANSSGISGRRFPEALMLASKVIAQPLVHLEICVSDDPSYTTGYIANKKTGYIRLPHIKKAGLTGGGRIYLLHHSPDTEELADLLSELRGRAFLFDKASPVYPPQKLTDLLFTCEQELKCPHPIHSSPG